LAAFVEANEADPIACNNYFDEPSKRIRGCSLGFLKTTCSKTSHCTPLLTSSVTRSVLTSVEERLSSSVTERGVGSFRAPG